MTRLFRNLPFLLFLASIIGYLTGILTLDYRFAVLTALGAFLFALWFEGFDLLGRYRRAKYFINHLDRFAYIIEETDTHFRLRINSLFGSSSEGPSQWVKKGNERLTILG